MPENPISFLLIIVRTTDGWAFETTLGEFIHMNASRLTSEMQIDIIDHLAKNQPASLTGLTIEVSHNVEYHR